MRAPEDCYRQRKKVGQFFPYLLHSQLSTTTGETRDCAAILWNFAQGNDCHVRCGNLNEQSLKELGKPFLLLQRQTLLWSYHCAEHPSYSQASPGDSQLCWDISVLMWMCPSLILLPQETVTWVTVRLVWQAWLKLGKNMHQWFKIFEEDLLVSRAQKTVLYKAPLPKKKFTLGL